MLTKGALETQDNPANDRMTESNEFESNFREKHRESALKVYKAELLCPPNLDLGMHGVQRASLRILCQNAVLESSAKMKRKYSYSAISSIEIKDYDGEQAVNALKQLQKERLIVSRLGFPDKAFELDQEIELMRVKAAKERTKEETVLLDQRMKLLAVSHLRKEQRLEFILMQETKAMNEHFTDEEDKCLKRQEIEFLRVLESATRRAIGRVKKCNCTQPYLCRHNKTASYNTRRPSKVVVQYRRNGKRLKQAGRPEEGTAWEEKAKEIDEIEQDKWCKRVSASIVASPWGANEAVVDQITELHKRELATLHKTHTVKRDMHDKQHQMRRRNFQNTVLAEARKVRMQCRKQALLRSKKNYEEEAREQKREAQLSYKSDGLKNVSKNLLGMEFTEQERAAVDWAPPTAFGMDNSVRLLDANQSNGDTRVMTSMQDIKEAKRLELQDKIRRANRGSDDDSENDSDDASAKERETHKYGTTSGSRYMDKLKRDQEKAERLKAGGDVSPSSASSPISPPRMGATGSTGGFTPGGFPPAGNNAFGGGGFPAPGGNSLGGGGFPSSSGGGGFPPSSGGGGFPAPGGNSFGGGGFPSSSGGGGLGGGFPSSTPSFPPSNSNVPGGNSFGGGGFPASSSSSAFPSTGIGGGFPSPSAGGTSFGSSSMPAMSTTIPMTPLSTSFSNMDIKSPYSSSPIKPFEAGLESPFPNKNDSQLGLGIPSSPMGTGMGGFSPVSTPTASGGGFPSSSFTPPGGSSLGGGFPSSSGAGGGFPGGSSLGGGFPSTSAGGSSVGGGFPATSAGGSSLGGGFPSSGGLGGGFPSNPSNAFNTPPKPSAPSAPPPSSQSFRNGRNISDNNDVVENNGIIDSNDLNQDEDGGNDEEEEEDDSD